MTKLQCTKTTSKDSNFGTSYMVHLPNNFIVSGGNSSNL